MQLPPRVQRDLDAAEALEASFQAPAFDPDIVQDVASLIAHPPTDPLAVAPQVPAAAPVAAPPAPVAQTVISEIEAKYKTLQGMYAKDVTRTKADLGMALERIQQLEAQERAKPTESATPAALDPKDVEEFGADIIKMVQRYVEQEVQELRGRVAALETQVTGVEQKTAQTREEAFYTLLDKLVPYWRDANVDPRWLAWLDVKDEVYGVPRDAALKAAYKRLDAEQVARIFDSFVKSLPAAPQPAESLESQVAPSGSGASVEPVQTPVKQRITQAAITKFYNDVGRGLFKGTQQEHDRIVAEIDDAVREGRVI